MRPRLHAPQLIAVGGSRRKISLSAHEMCGGPRCLEHSDIGWRNIDERMLEHDGRGKYIPGRRSQPLVLELLVKLLSLNLRAFEVGSTTCLGGNRRSAGVNVRIFLDLFRSNKISSQEINWHWQVKDSPNHNVLRAIARSSFFALLLGWRC
jgi:hypothetical protein